MRIYFSASITGGREQAHLYPAIIEHLRQYGEVLTEFVADQAYTAQGEQQLTPEAIYQRDIGYISQCDVLVAEVTVPSFGVGVEVARASVQGKPVLALYQPAQGRRLSAMIAGDPNVTVVEYKTQDDLEHPLGAFFKNYRKSDRYSFNRVSIELLSTYTQVLRDAQQNLSNRNDVSSAEKFLATFCAENFQLLKGITLLINQQELLAPILLTRPIVENWLTWGYIKGDKEARSQQFIANSVKRQIESSETFFKQNRLSTKGKNSLRKITRERKEQVSDIAKRYGCWPDSIKEIAKQADSSNNTNIYTKRWESFFKFLSTYQHPGGMKSADFISQNGDQTILTPFRSDRSLPVFEIGLSYSNVLMLDINDMLKLKYRESLEPFGTEVMDIPILD